jgi:pyruvyltransferase
VKGKIPLFWWSERLLMKKSKENFGDLLSKYIVEKISEKSVRWIHPKKIRWFQKNDHYFGIGSILHLTTKYSSVWGSGIINEELSIEAKRFYAVRGPRTREYLLKRNIHCPEIYGDPGILLSDFFKPRIKKKYDVGIVPHYVDFNKVKAKFEKHPSIRVVDLMTNDIEKTAIEIIECESIISSSLHGVIIAHTYGIPAICVKFSDEIYGDGIKYKDYYESINIPFKERMKIDLETMSFDRLNNIIKNQGTRPDENMIRCLKKGLIESCPFN